MTEHVPSSNGMAASGNARKKHLIEELDGLLERYLHTLDEYQKVREELSKQLSSGYMSLAQANFHNSSSAIRYGKDCYDDRMQAIRTVQVLDDSARSGRSQFTIRKQNHVSPSEHADPKSSDENLTPGTTTWPDPPDAPNADDAKSTHEPGGENETPSTSSVRSADPLRWFGILVPPALRTAQSTFITAVEGPVARMATVAMDLRSQEIEVGRMRKQIKKLS